MLSRKTFNNLSKVLIYHRKKNEVWEQNLRSELYDLNPPFNPPCVSLGLFMTSSRDDIKMMTEASGGHEVPSNGCHLGLAPGKPGLAPGKPGLTPPLGSDLCMWKCRESRSECLSLTLLSLLGKALMSVNHKSCPWHQRSCPPMLPTFLCTLVGFTQIHKFCLILSYNMTCSSPQGYKCWRWSKTHQHIVAKKHGATSMAPSLKRTRWGKGMNSTSGWKTMPELPHPLFHP